MTADYSRTVMRQYANSTALIALLEAFAEWVDLDKFTDDFLLHVWDISTATGFGLDIWGRILGRDRFLELPQAPGNNFGFNINANPGTQWQPFNQAPFFNGQATGTTSFALQDDAYRQLLLVKAAANIASCDCPSLNALLRAMFGTRGECYVGYDPAQPMHIGYHFDFFPSALERSIIESGLFPVPAGMTVRFIYKTLTYSPFGFASQNSGADPTFVTGFNQGPFYNPPPEA
jgi:hypothetical protein